MRALQARVRALQRILAPELAVVRLRQLSEEFCIESSVVQANGQPPSQPSCLHPAGGLRRLPALNLHGGPQIPGEVPGQKRPPRPQRPPSLPNPLVPALSHSRLLAGMNTIAQSSRQSAPTSLHRQAKYKKLCALCVLCGKKGTGFPPRPE